MALRPFVWVRNFITAPGSAQNVLKKVDGVEEALEFFWKVRWREDLLIKKLLYTLWKHQL